MTAFSLESLRSKSTSFASVAFKRGFIGDPVSKFTLQNFGFSDAAEAFVFLSGLSCGIVYLRVLRRVGWAGLTAALSKRVSQIYVYYVLASIAVILILKIAEGAIKNADVSHSFLVLRETPISAIWSTVLLTSPPDLPGILVIYLVLTSVVIPLFLWGAGASAVLTLTASGFVWAISQIYPNLLPHLADHSYFNPLAWQFLFSVGMFVGLQFNSGSPRPRTTSRNTCSSVSRLIVSYLCTSVRSSGGVSIHDELLWIACARALADLRR